MTSRLRRKPLTTVRNTSTTRHRSTPERFALVATLLVVGLLWAQPARAGEVQRIDSVAAGDDAGVAAVSYTTGSAGHQLKWLPYRPAKPTTSAARRPQPATDGSVHTAAMMQAVEAAPPANPVLADPFGDAGAQPAAPPALLSDSALQEAQPTPSSGSMQTLPDPPSAAAAQPLVTPRPPVAAQPPATTQPESQPPVEPFEIPSMDQELAAGPQPKVGECKLPKDAVKAIHEIDYKIAAEPGEFPTDCPLGDERFVPRAWPSVTFAWTASALCHKPLYFEEVALERYGHTCGPLVQPFVSAGHFFLTVPVLPYLMGVYPPHECIYTLGYYRPGNCAPRLLDPIPLSVRAALIEGGVVTGLVFLIP